MTELGAHHEHFQTMPSVWRFMPRLLWGMAGRPTQDTRVPRLSVSAPLMPDASRLARFRTSVGDSRRAVPPTWPAACMTPLLVALVSDKRFPFPAIGLVHRSEEIRVLAPLPDDRPIVLHARLGDGRKVSAGVAFDIHARGEVDGKVVWRSTSEIVWRAPGPRRSRTQAEVPEVPAGAAAVSVDLRMARAYAAASKNRDPIHTIPALARALGMPGVVMHGLWTLARAVTHLPPLEPPFEMRARFRRPVVVPTTVHFAWQDEDGGHRLVVHPDDEGRVYVTGFSGPIDPVDPCQAEPDD